MPLNSGKLQTINIKNSVPYMETRDKLFTEKQYLDQLTNIHGEVDNWKIVLMNFLKRKKNMFSYIRCRTEKFFIINTIHFLDVN